MAMPGVHTLLLSLKRPFCCVVSRKEIMEEYICFWEDIDVAAKQGGTSNQQLQNSYFWAVLVLALANAKGQ